MNRFQMKFVTCTQSGQGQLSHVLKVLNVYNEYITVCILNVNIFILLFNDFFSLPVLLFSYC